jgi:hypothetical protein
MKKQILFMLIAIFAVVSAQAGDSKVFYSDQAAAKTRVLSDGKGNVLRITAIPPLGKQVDPRVFEGWEFPGQQIQANLSSSETPVNLSGYQFVLESTGSTNFKSVIKKIRSAHLDPKSSVIFGNINAVDLDITAVPTKGDVDVFLLKGNNACSHSANAGRALDAATCFFSNGDVHGKTPLNGFIRAKDSGADFIATVHVFLRRVEK